MRKTFILSIAVVLIALAIPAFAELQNVIVGGSLQMRGNWWDGASGSDLDAAGISHHSNPLFVAPWDIAGRFFTFNNAAQANLRWNADGAGRVAAVSPRFGWNDDNFNNAFVEQRTRLNVRADFTDQVSAFVELDSYDIWGQDFRSNYINGADGVANSVDDVEVYQAYIQTEDMFGQPLRLRIGRQEMKFGSTFLVGAGDSGPYFTGLSFDGIRATYTLDQLAIDAFWTKLAERSGLEEDGDVDFYGLYASYTGIENVTLDAYYFLVRDARELSQTSANGTILGYVNSYFERAAGVDDYDPTYLNTIGLRGAGTYGPVDFEAELAYQFGEADAFGVNSYAGALYGDDSANFGTWGGNFEVGYTFDINYQPRVFLGGAYFGGEDNRDVNFGEWVRAAFFPYFSKDASVSFNRLFSFKQYSNFLDLNLDLSNVWLLRTGVTVSPTESVKVNLTATYFEALDTFETLRYWQIAGTRVVPFFPLPFWSTSDNSSDLGWEVALNAHYNYTEDLGFEVGYAHFFTGEGLKDGNFINSNGSEFNGGSKDDDANYFYAETSIKF